MLRNQKVVRVLVPEHFNADNFVRYHNRMGAVGNEILDALQPGNCISPAVHETDVMAEKLDGTARFLSPKLPKLCALLVNDLKLRVAAYSCGANLLPGLGREQQSASRDCGESALYHTLLLV
jgi:hypothetical protein